MKRTNAQTEGLLLKALLALSMTAVPSVGVLAGVKANTTKNPLLKATATTQNSALQRVQANTRTITGVVKDAQGEPLIGVSVQVKGTGKGSITNIDGQYTLTTNESNPTLVFSYVGYTAQELAAGGRSQIDVTLKEDSKVLGEVVVTAMGIMRKQESLTYATQKVKAEDLMKVQDPNVANTLEGKVAGVTITPSAGGAGGASKIILRGNKSITGNNSPLIVVDGIPLTNETRGKITNGDELGYAGSSEGSDPLSMINPDDIESINVLKGANAAALYGSRAANGVIMITTKSGREGKVDINFTSNVTFDTPLLTPKLQDSYGAALTEGSVVNGTQTYMLSPSSWGGKLSDQTNLLPSVQLGDHYPEGALNQVHLRNRAVNDIDNFFRTGVTTNNSVSVSGGTEKSQTYISLGNSHANGMIKHNSYNRNSITLRQSFKLFDRLKLEGSVNYVETITRNRPGGGTIGNPIYHTYLSPRNVDMDYYAQHYSRPGSWLSGLWNYYEARTIDVLRGGSVQKETYYVATSKHLPLSGEMQDWAYLSNNNNNPYWLVNKNSNRQDENRLFTTLSATIDIYKGLSFQARFNYTKTHFTKDARRYATTFVPSNISSFGSYWSDDFKTTELYTDYLLSYNTNVKDFSISATAGWVGHTIKNTYKNTAVGNATTVDPNRRILPSIVNLFETKAGDVGATTTRKDSNWDKAMLFTAQVGWQDKVFVDGSYRLDAYRPYRQFKLRGIIDSEWQGYFGVGANAIVSSLVKLPTWIDYLKYRVSYSDVGNSIPNNSFFNISQDFLSGTATVNKYADFVPKVETLGSFETGVEMLFLKNRLSFDFTYYDSRLRNMYMESGNIASKTNAGNTGKVRNVGFETTIGYDFKFGKDLRWRTSYNLSFNDNKILQTAYDNVGNQKEIKSEIAGVYVIHKPGGSIGDMYVDDFKRDANGHIKLTKKGAPRFDKSGNGRIYVGNMNSKWQMGWSNTFNYKDFSLSMLINGRLGGKVISLTEAYLDLYGLSERSGKARLDAEKNGIVASNYGNVPGIALLDGSGRIVPIETYYKTLGGSDNPNSYIYSATNFRLRELSLGYTFRNLVGQNKNLSVSFIARNLFFLYKESPADPDVSLSTGNGLGGFELFNTPSSRSYGLSLKLNL